MRIERITDLPVIIKSTEAAEPHDIITVWNIRCSALVRHSPAGHNEPADLQIEDREIDEVVYEMQLLGTHGVRETTLTRADEIQLLAALNDWLAGRDDWQDSIRFAAIQEFRSQLASPRELAVA